MNIKGVMAKYLGNRTRSWQEMFILFFIPSEQRVVNKINGPRKMHNKVLNGLQKMFKNIENDQDMPDYVKLFKFDNFRQIFCTIWLF